MELIDVFNTLQVHLTAPGILAHFFFEFVEFSLVDDTVVVHVVFPEEFDESLLVEILESGLLVEWHFWILLFL